MIAYSPNAARATGTAVLILALLYAAYQIRGALFVFVLAIFFSYTVYPLQWAVRNAGCPVQQFKKFRRSWKPSARERGKTDEKDKESIASQFEGGFVLMNGMMTFSDLSFAIPGAAVRLDGTYGLRTEELKFNGTVKMEAKLSELTTGAKSVLRRHLPSSRRR